MGLYKITQEVDKEDIKPIPTRRQFLGVLAGMTVGLVSAPALIESAYAQENEGITIQYTGEYTPEVIRLAGIEGLEGALRNTANFQITKDDGVGFFSPLRNKAQRVGNLNYGSFNNEFLNNVFQYADLNGDKKISGENERIIATLASQLGNKPIELIYNGVPIFTNGVYTGNSIEDVKAPFKASRVAQTALANSVLRYNESQKSEDSTLDVSSTINREILERVQSQVSNQTEESGGSSSGGSDSGSGGSSSSGSGGSGGSGGSL